MKPETLCQALTNHHLSNIAHQEFFPQFIGEDGAVEVEVKVTAFGEKQLTALDQGAAATVARTNGLFWAVSA